MNKSNILSELSHKKKNVSDIIRYIKNVSPNREQKLTPNFSILLGSGASVTSGVRSGEQLVREWKKEILSELHDVDLTADIDKVWKEHIPEWFDTSNSYSSLFEHQYDLQRQRRIFVENEVSDKDPSIGYAYLVKLISSNYFNTVFTTNFDDLLNEAFYRFSTIRPMVCAHDSSISGVTVTSERPKIIKLHGDYLFDNIKTTMRETESLETNMRMKFKEFARDFGLIVIGYSGQDRSIMDILSYLLDQESYFKNGIYWCVRKGTTEISNELKNLLWKDRVYYIEIDGFDEFMAELNNSLNEGNLPVDDSYFGYAHQELMIKKLIDNKFLCETPSTILKSDMNKIKKRVKSTKMDDFINFLKEEREEGMVKTSDRNKPSKRNKLKELTKEQNEIVYKIKDIGLLKRSVKEAISIIDTFKPFELEDSQFKLELLEIYADFIKRGDDEEVKKYTDELIRLNPDEERYYVMASNKSCRYEQGYDYIKMATTKFENDYYIHNKLAEYILNYCEDVFVDNVKLGFIDEAINSLNKSISLFKSIDNIAYIHLIRAYQLKYANDTTNKNKKVQDIKEQIRGLSDKHLNFLKAMNRTNDDQLSDETFTSFKEYYLKADNPIAVETIVIEYIKWLKGKGDTKKQLAIMEEYESGFIPSENYLRVKIDYLISNEEFDKAMIILDTIKIDASIIGNKMELLYYLGKDEELDNYYNSFSKVFDVELAYYSAKRDDENIIKKLEQRKERFGELDINELVSLSFSYLKLRRYADAETLLKPYYDNPQMKTGEIIINYLFAKYHGDKVSLSRKAKEKIINKDNVVFSNDVLAVAWHFAGNDSKSLDYLQKEINLRPVHKYDVLNWPVLYDLKNNDRFKKITKLKYDRDKNKES